MAAEKIDALQLDITSKASTESIDKLIDSLNKLGTALDKINNKKVSVGIENAGKAANKASKSFLSQAVKITAVIALYRKLSKVIGSGIAKAAEYTKTLNMVTLSMGDYTDNAIKYANAVRDAVGIDPAGWLKAQGIFQTLITGFGVTGDKAAYMSQNITQLSYDIASFYGITNEEAQNKLKSALSGRLEPIRKLGYDLSQAKLVDIAKNPANYGKQTFKVNEQTGAIEANTKAVDDNTKHKIVNFNQLTQQEKVQLRYIALMTQVTQVQGNYAKALNDPANQMNVFKENLNQLSRALGSVFIPALNKVLPYLTAVAQYAAKAFQNLAAFFGYEIPDMKDRTDISGNTKPYNDVVKATDQGAKNAKKMKDYMIGIDELNVLNPNTGATGGTGSGNKGQNSNLKNLKLPGYDFLGKALESAIKKAKENLALLGEWFKKNPLKAVVDIVIGGTGELMSKFWEKILGKTPAELAEEAKTEGRTIGEQFLVSLTHVSNPTAWSLVEQVKQALFGADSGYKAAAAGHTVSQQFWGTFALEMAKKIKANPLLTWFYNLTAGKSSGMSIDEVISQLETKLAPKNTQDYTVKGNTSAEEAWRKGREFGKQYAEGLKSEEKAVSYAGKCLYGATKNGVDSYGEASKTFYNTAANQAAQYGKGLASKISDVEVEGSHLGNAGANGLSNDGKTDKQFKTNATSSAKSFINNLATPFLQNNAYSKAVLLATKGASGAGSKEEDYKTAGKNSGAGYGLGIITKDNLEKAKKAAGTLATNALSKLKKILGIESPSKAYGEAGYFSVLGYSKAFDKYSYLASDAASNMATSAVKAVETTNKMFGDARALSNKIILNGTVADPMASGVSVPTSTNAGYNISAANTNAMASLAGNIYQAVVSGMSNARINTTSDNGDIKVIIDGKEVFKAVQTESRKRGVAISNGAFSR